MKELILFIVCICLFSCSKYEQNEETQIHHSYNPEQNYIINVRLIPTEDLIIDLDAINLEVNADYYNRYGIAVNIELSENYKLDDKFTLGQNIFLPTNISKDYIDLYIVPENVIKFDGANGYAVLEQNSIVVKSTKTLNSTIAHEIAHIFLGLEHSDDKENIMYSHNFSTQFTEPKSFSKEQIEIIKSKIKQ